jgi:hypothetical protein
MSTIKVRLGNLEFANKKKNTNYLVEHIEGVRQMLERIDGISELGLIPGEGLALEMYRRMETADGYSLNLMPGATIEERQDNVEKAYDGKIAVSPEARRAARGHFALYDGL